MKVLVIPDVHLKSNMFREAAALMHAKVANQAVCLMDIADDWNRQYDVFLYEETYQEAIRFAKKFPETLWCYGNHDLSYLWYCPETGYSSVASYTVQKRLLDLKEILTDENPIRYVHKIDHVLFSHAGLSNDFVENYVPKKNRDDVDKVVERINRLGRVEIWSDDSPIWIRPQQEKLRLYKPRKLLQVVGHTPVEKIVRQGNLISCDVFSTRPDQSPIGTQEFLLLNTKTWDYCGIKI